MRTNKTQMIGAAAALAAVMALPTAAAADGHGAKVRVGHFSPDAPAVDVWVNDAAVLEDVEFGALSPYLDLEPGTYSIAVVAADGNPADGAVIGPVDLPFEAGSRTTVAATDFLENITPVVLDDAFVNQEGEAQVRVVHFSPDAPVVDIAADGQAALIEGLAFPKLAGYVGLPEGEYDLEIRAAGTDQVAFDIPAIPLAGDTAYTVFAIGSLEAGTFDVLPVADSETDMADEMDDAEMADDMDEAEASE